MGFVVGRHCEVAVPGFQGKGSTVQIDVASDKTSVVLQCLTVVLPSSNTGLTVGLGSVLDMYVCSRELLLTRQPAGGTSSKDTARCCHLHAY